MPIICLEGPNAVGKTTVASALAAADEAFVVPEVNVLFERPPDEPPEWYFERQVDRWSAGSNAARLTIDDSAGAIRSAARSARLERRPVELFDYLIEWLRTHAP